eukprot:2154548-Lingulodinium_polyedra.AAC.1
MAGCSLGDYTALCAAGAMSFEDGLKLVRLQSEATQEEGRLGGDACLYVVGLEEGELRPLCVAAAQKEGGSA